MTMAIRILGFIGGAAIVLNVIDVVVPPVPWISDRSIARHKPPMRNRGSRTPTT